MITSQIQEKNLKISESALFLTVKILTEKFLKLNKQKEQFCLKFYGLQFGHIFKAIRPRFEIDQSAKSIEKKNVLKFFSLFSMKNTQPKFQLI